MKLEDSFVPHEVAKAYKEAGFNEPCFAWWMYPNSVKLDSVSTQPPHDDFCSAPTYEQLSNWLREYHDILLCPLIRRSGPDLLYGFNVISISTLSLIDESSKVADYDVAYSEALLKALKHLKK